LLQAKLDYKEEPVKESA